MIAAIVVVCVCLFAVCMIVIVWACILLDSGRGNP